MTHFYRACPTHRDELEEVDKGVDGQERLWCPQGHYVTSWLVISDSGSKIGRAHIGRMDMTVGDEPKKERAPQKEPIHPCKHGHTDWSYQPATRRWRCRTCNRMRSRIENPRTRAKRFIDLKETG